MPESTFVIWLLRELEERDLSQSEFARRADVARGHVSRIISGARYPGLDFYRKVAATFRIPLAEVLIAAGEMPDLESLKNDPEIDGIMQRLVALPEDQREQIFDLLHNLLDVATGTESSDFDHKQKRGEKPGPVSNPLLGTKFEHRPPQTSEEALEFMELLDPDMARNVADAASIWIKSRPTMDSLDSESTD